MRSTEETTISEVQSANKECHSYTYIEYMRTYYVYIASIHSYMGHTHTKHEIPRNYTYINTLHITLLHVYTYICVQCYTYKFCKHTSMHIESCTLTYAYIYILYIYVHCMYVCMYSYIASHINVRMPTNYNYAHKSFTNIHTYIHIYI